MLVNFDMLNSVTQVTPKTSVEKSSSAKDFEEVLNNNSNISSLDDGKKLPENKIKENDDINCEEQSLSTLDEEVSLDNVEIKLSETILLESPQTDCLNEQIKDELVDKLSSSSNFFKDLLSKLDTLTENLTDTTDLTTILEDDTLSSQLKEVFDFLVAVNNNNTEQGLKATLQSNNDGNISLTLELAVNNNDIDFSPENLISDEVLPHIEIASSAIESAQIDLASIEDLSMSMKTNSSAYLDVGVLKETLVTVADIVDNVSQKIDADIKTINDLSANKLVTTDFESSQELNLNDEISNIVKVLTKESELNKNTVNLTQDGRTNIKKSNDQDVNKEKIAPKSVSVSKEALDSKNFEKTESKNTLNSKEGLTDTSKLVAQDFKELNISKVKVSNNSSKPIQVNNTGTIDSLKNIILSERNTLKTQNVVVESTTNQDKVINLAQNLKSNQEISLGDEFVEEGQSLSGDDGLTLNEVSSSDLDFSESDFNNKERTADRLNENILEKTIKSNRQEADYFTDLLKVTSDIKSSQSSASTSSILSTLFGNKLPLNPGNTSQNAKNVAEKVMEMSARNLREVELELTPANLGKLKIHIDIDDVNNARVSFNVSSARTKELLEQSVAELKELLESSGMNLKENSISQDLNQQEHSDGYERAKDAWQTNVQRGLKSNASEWAQLLSQSEDLMNLSAFK